MTMGRSAIRRLAWSAVLALACLVTAASAQAPDNRRWLPLERDGVHDPKSPAIGLLQQPQEALSKLAPDTAGNQVRWMEALGKGQINPRQGVTPDIALELRETEIYLNLKGGTPIVRFPHRQHTLWLACSNCHDALFKPQIGANKLDMRRMLQGEQCGLCHGAVSFPLTECNRCHNTSRIGFVAPATRAAGAGSALVPSTAGPPAQAKR